MKVIAFDLVGVLVSEKDIDLPSNLDKLERNFGKDISNQEFVNYAKQILGDQVNINNTVEYIINSLYQTKNLEIIEIIKKEYPNIKIAIATNHVKQIRTYIEKNFNLVAIDKLFISSEININKPHNKFFQYILDYYGIEPNQLLFIDDNIDNIQGAKKLNIITIHVTKDTNLLLEIKKQLNN